MGEAQFKPEGEMKEVETMIRKEEQGKEEA